MFKKIKCWAIVSNIIIRMGVLKNGTAGMLAMAIKEIYQFLFINYCLSSVEIDLRLLQDI